MKKIVMGILLIFNINTVWSQMPTDGNYQNWNWEDQHQNNWKRKEGNIWVEIDPPFLFSTERIGEIVGIYEKEDYTKAKGWKLLWAQFNGMYPYFILYNPHKSVIRVFFYTEDRAFSYLLVSLSYHDIINPGLLTFGNEYQMANDKFLDENFAYKNDLISVIIPSVGVKSWCAADFPIFFDSNIKNNSYKSKKWVFQFFGCENNIIHLKDKSHKNKFNKNQQHTISGNSADISGSSFSANHAKLHKQIESTHNLLQKMHNSVKTIDDKSPEFLRNYKSTVNSLKPVSDTFAAVTSFSSAIGAILGFLKTIIGTFNEKQSTIPAITEQLLELEGTMEIKYVLGGNTLKIPGVDGPSFPPTNWETYDCPMGLISLQKTPIVRATTAYEKFAFDDETIQLWVNPNATDDIMWIAQLYDFPVLIAEGNHPAVSGYLGQFVKYKFEDEIIVAVNKIAGSTLKDIRFALIFKLKGVGNEKFNIEDKYIYCKFWGFGGGEHHVPIVNPIYKALDEGLLKIYKYENNYTYIGTPELQANQLKDIVIEAPEKSDLFLRVIAIFESNKYKTPIIFQGDYLVDFKIEKANIKRLFAGIEQTNFHWDQYYQGKTKITLNSKDSNSHTAGRIALNPNFVGKLGFSAKAINLYPSRGNTVIKNYEYACNKNYRQSYTSSLFLQQSPTNVKIDQNETKLNIYPNPSCGNIVVYINDGQKIANITIFDSLGNIVYSKRNILQIKTNIDLGDLPAGIYFIRVTLYNHKTYSNTFLINK